jgi:hypothetical protein
MAVVESIQSMPRALKWASFAGVFMILYFAAVEPALGHLDRVNAKADIMRVQLVALQQQLLERESNIAALSKGLQDHGPAVAPGPADDRGDQVYDLLREVTTELGILDGWRFVPGELGLQSPALEREFVQPADELVRLTFTFSFEASPEDVMETISRFEASPAVQSISSLRIGLGQDGRRTLSVQMVLESWAMRGRERR